MKRHLHFNCFSGAGGDMILSALIDLGADDGLLDRKFHKLDIGVKKIGFFEVMRGGMRGLLLKIEESGNGHAHVEPHDHDHDHDHDHEYGPHRRLGDMLEIVERSGASPVTKERASRALNLLAEAEGHIHNKPPEEIRFHEISGVDTIVDVLGSCIALEMLDVGSVSASRVTVGRGMVHCAHGTFTVPAPATLEILAGAGIPYEQGGVDGEFLTPTGAALLAAVAGELGSSPAMRPVKNGYGAGSNDYDGHANLLQATLGVRI